MLFRMSHGCGMSSNQQCDPIVPCVCGGKCPTRPTTLTSIADSRSIDQYPWSTREYHRIKVTRLSLQVIIFSDCVGKPLPSSSGAMVALDQHPMVTHPHPTNDYDDSCPNSLQSFCGMYNPWHLRVPETEPNQGQIITWSKIQKIGVGW